eukprot:1794809-Prymnesium_polylepis.2
MSMSCRWLRWSLDTTPSIVALVKLMLGRISIVSTSVTSTCILITSSPVSGAQIISCSCGYCDSQLTSLP